MSLKAFHIFFIFLAILLAAGCAAWGFANGLAPAARRIARIMKKIWNAFSDI